ncbi:DUF3566 domain-containing protein [Pseudonocardia lutea]|uniref:DUF3566 domain-containing protein n=1 Tax=Pseudonocardia lutea TaxID=2172015 RepID=A0ABW1IE07_9PSEU
MSENEKPATPPGAQDEGRVATDSPEPTQLPGHGAAAVPTEAGAAEDRTTPAAAEPGSAGNGSAGAASASGAASGAASAPSGNGSTSSNGSAVSPVAGVAAAGDTDGSSSRPVPSPRPEAATSGAGPDGAGESQEARPGTVPTPPPWRRAQGEEDTDGTEGADRAAGAPTPRPAPQRSPAVDSLLSEAPTAYIDRNAAPGAAGIGAAAGAATLPGGTGAEVHAEVPNVAGRAPRQALLQVKRFDPWSVLKLALVLAVVLFFIWLVAVGVLYGVLDGMGVWDRLNGTYADLVSGGGQGGGGSLISAGSVFGFAAIIGAINSLLFAVALTVGAFVYNVSADLVGGIEVTLSERD